MQMECSSCPNFKPSFNGYGFEVEQSMGKILQTPRSPVPREWLTYQYLDSKAILVAFASLARDLPLDKMPYAVKSFRTNTLKRAREARQAALFCYGLGQALGIEISFAMVEESDFDVIAAWPSKSPGAMSFCTIQLKEWVPEFIPKAGELQAELDKLGKYSDSKDLVVAFHLNRDARVEPDKLRMPTGIKELWFFGASSPTQREWYLIGNCMGDWSAYTFQYPT